MENKPLNYNPEIHDDTGYPWKYRAYKAEEDFRCMVKANESAIKREKERYNDLFQIANGLARYADGHELRGQWLDELRSLHNRLKDHKRI